MFKYTIVIFALIAGATAKPQLVTPFGYSAPLAGVPGVVTATRSQVIARNCNGIATAPVLAADPFAARYVSSPTSLTASYVASPLAYNSAPFAYSAPLGYASAYGYNSPYSYAAQAEILL